MTRRAHLLLVAVCCVLPPVMALYCLLGLYVDFFFWDEWNVLVRFSLSAIERKEEVWSILWEPHFSHRLVLLKTLSLINFQLFDGNQLPLLLLAWTIQVALFLRLVSTEYFRLESPFARALVAVSLSLLLFSPGMMLAWLWPMCLQQLLTTLFFCWAMQRVPYLHRTASSGLLNTLAVACTFSSGNGLVVWPAAILLGVLMQVPLKRLVPTALVGALTYLVYFYEMPVEHAGDASASVADRLLYVLAFIGAPLSSRNTELAITIGLIGSLIYAYLMLRALLTCNEASLTALSFAWLSIASACAGAGYRIGSGGVEQALVDRYIALSIPFWAGLIIGASHYAERLRIRNTFLAGPAALCLAAYLPLLGPEPIDPKAFLASRHSYVRLSYEAIREGVFASSGTDPYKNLFPHPNGVLTGLAEMKRHAVGLFRADVEPDDRLLGTDLNFSSLCKDCAAVGVLEAVEPPFIGIDLCKGGYEIGAFVHGTIYGDGHDIKRIVLVNSHNEIVGKGFPIGQFRFFTEPSVLSRAVERGWMGFVSGERLSEKLEERVIRAFAVMQQNSTLLPIAGELQVEDPVTACGERRKTSFFNGPENGLDWWLASADFRVG